LDEAELSHFRWKTAPHQTTDHRRAGEGGQE
jgi:hypothetical protein